MRFDLSVRRARVATASDVFDADIGIRGGRIVALADCLAAGPGTREIDAAGRFVTPGGIDSHCHLGQPMLPPVRMADDFVSGTRSAACSGTTTVIPFAAQAKGGALRAAVDDCLQRAAGKASVDDASHLIVADPTPEALNQELPALIAEGCTSFKNGLSRPGPVEREATHRAITLAEPLDLPILIEHVSGAEAIEQTRWARDKANQQVVWDGLADGLFNVLSSDHAPFNCDDPAGKRLGGQEPPFPCIPNRIPGLETRMPVLFSEGALAGRLSIQQFTGAPGLGQFLRCERPVLARPRTRSGGWRQWLELDA